jgi:hypothetical protein
MSEDPETVDASSSSFVVTDAEATPFTIDDDEDDGNDCGNGGLLTGIGHDGEAATKGLQKDAGGGSEGAQNGPRVESIARIAASILDEDGDEDANEDEPKVAWEDSADGPDDGGDGDDDDGRALREDDDGGWKGERDRDARTYPSESVPFSQFQNALTVIQDLEARLRAVEARNGVLERETVEQRYIIGAYEQKLQEFPQLIEDAVKHGDRQAAAAVAVASKEAFWKEYMNRQEEQERKKQEAEKKKGKGGNHFSNLKQSDFLRDLVVVKQEEKKQARFWRKAVTAAKGKRTSNTCLDGVGGDDDRREAGSATPGARFSGGGSSSENQVLNLLS